MDYTYAIGILILQLSMAADSVGLRAASKATQQTVRHPKLNRAERVLIKPTNLRLKRKATAFRSRSTLCTKLLPSPFRPCRSLKRTRSSARVAINRRVDGKGGGTLLSGTSRWQSDAAPPPSVASGHGPRTFLFTVHQAAGFGRLPAAVQTCAMAAEPNALSPCPFLFLFLLLPVWLLLLSAALLSPP